MTRSAGTPEARGNPASPSAEIDITVPSVARIYDYVLGGKENFESDRAAARGLLRTLPEAAAPARENRAFLRRAVRYLVAEAGIRQILDIGSGLPTEGNVHEVAQAIDPSVHVVYVDIDPIVLAHGRALLARSPHTTVVTADVRDPDTIFTNARVRDLIDPTRPFAILLAGVLHHLPDSDDPVGVVDDLIARLPVGGHLLISNLLGGDHPRSKELEQAFRHNRISAARFRTWPEQRRFFAGLEMVEPGLVYVNDWRPDAETPTESAVHTLHVAGIGRKTA
jgi:S-adenosyl methyltransferase